jgi:hypothetical protein
MAKRVVFVLLAALGCFGQTIGQETRRPSSGERSEIVWPKSHVTVVFAPEHRQARQGAKSPRLDSLESWIQNVNAEGPTKNMDQPVEFAAPGGAVGIRVGPESAIATTMIIGDDGKRHMECARFPETLERLKAAVPAAHSVRTANDK